MGTKFFPLSDFEPVMMRLKKTKKKTDHSKIFIQRPPRAMRPSTATAAVCFVFFLRVRNHFPTPLGIPAARFQNSRLNISDFCGNPERCSTHLQWTITVGHPLHLFTMSDFLTLVSAFALLRVPEQEAVSSVLKQGGLCLETRGSDSLILSECRGIGGSRPQSQVSHLPSGGSSGQSYFSDFWAIRASKAFPGLPASMIIKLLSTVCSFDVTQ